MLTLVILYLALNWLPTLVIASGHPPALGSAAAMVFNLAGVVGALVLGPATDRYGWRWPLTAAYLALAAVMAGLALATTPDSILALSGAAGLLVMGAQFSLYAVAPILYPPALRGLGSGVAVGVGRLGSIAGPLVAGELRAAGATPGEVFGAMTPVAIVAGALVLALAAGMSRLRARAAGSS
jgi:AAHS family 3-hydroxyphenylpropionic acid transporter